MGDESLAISKDQFMQLDVKAQNGIMYEFITDIHSRITVVEKCTENYKLRNAIIAAVSGLVAGSGGTIAIGKILIQIGIK